MPDHKPEPWESGAAAPFLLIDTANGTPGSQQIITGFDEAEQAADALAKRLG